MNIQALPRVDSLKIVPGDTVLARMTLDVPMLRDGERMLVTDDSRLRKMVPTLEELISKGARTVIIGHVGRPIHGKYDPEKTTEPAAIRLAQLLGKQVAYLPDWDFKTIADMLKQLPPGGLMMCPNARFNPSEQDEIVITATMSIEEVIKLQTKKRQEREAFANSLCGLGKYFIFDDAPAAWRPTNSSVNLAPMFPSDRRAIGSCCLHELELLEQLRAFTGPLILMVGGDKLDKLPLIRHFIKPGRQLILIFFGKMSFTFSAANGNDIPVDLVDQTMLQEAEDILTLAHNAGATLVLPSDYVIVSKGDLLRLMSDDLTTPNEPKVIPYGHVAYDIGHEARAAVGKIIKEAPAGAKIIWDGAPGLIISNGRYMFGALRICEALAGTKAQVNIFGGDTVGLVRSLSSLEGKENVIFFTAGGSGLAYLVNPQSWSAIQAFLN